MSDLIDRQAVIDMLAAMQGRCTSKAALIQNSKIWQQIKDFPSAQPEQRWIPCEEALPDTDETMLVTAQPKKGAPNVNRAYYMDGFWHGSGSMSNVVAWVPLPEPYKGEQE